MDKVSIVMAARGRPETTRRSLKSFSKLSYPDWELIFTDVVAEGSLKSICDEFEGKMPIRYIPFGIDSKIRTPARTWNHGFRYVEGRYVIFTGADILISEPDMIERFLKQEKPGGRINVLTYHLSEDITKNLDNIDWFENPKIIQDQHLFWDTIITGETNRMRKQAGLTTFIAGMDKKQWEWLGLFREEDSHLTSDQDLLMRFYALHWASDTLDDYVAYHQWHPVIQIQTTPGWIYRNEAQARLLEPAERER